jgi:hypothetical protein
MGLCLLALSDGIGKYDGYTDNTSSYRFRYFSPALTFGDPSRIKLLKKIRPTFVGLNEGKVFVKWAYDFESAFKNYEISVGDQNPAFFGVSQYGIG